MVDNIEPIVPEGTPLPTPPVGVPPSPITPFAVWTWDSPVIPSFYWNVYSAEQRVKMICKEIGKIEAYLNYLVNKTNENLIDLQNQITVLDSRLTALEKKLADEVSRLDGLLAKLREDLTAETKAREDADAALDSSITTESNKLHTEISTETQNRIHADDALHGEITAESEKLHGEISAEAQARIHADDSLHNEISAETQARQDADSALEAKLTGEIAKRLLPTDVTAGDEISITQPDPSSNRIVIASTVAHSISCLETEVSGVKAALDAEVSERRSEDTKLWQAVNQRIERGKILAGEGISVVNDPDASTVTISSTGSADISAIEAKAEAASTTAGEAKTTAEAAQATATGAESKAEEALTAAQGSLKGVAHTASLAGDGTSSTPLSLTPATATTLGGVKVGSGLAVTTDGTLSATAQGGGTGITEVAHDATLKGTGATGSPLGVNYGSGLKVEGGKLTAEVTQAELAAVDSKATTAASTAQEAKTAAQGSLKGVAHTASLAGDGTSSTPLSLTPATATTLGGVKVGSGLAVTTDGTLSTTGLTKVAHGATLTGNGTSSSPLEVKNATENTAGVLTEARVRELGASGLTEVAHDESLEGDGVPERPLKVKAGTENQIGGVKEAEDGSITIWDDGRLIPREVTPETEKAEEIGMVSQNTIKRVSSDNIDERRGLSASSFGGTKFGLKVSSDVFGFTSSGELALSDRQVFSGEKEEDLDEACKTGAPFFLQTIGNGARSFYLLNAKFSVKKTASSPWEEAEAGSFELFALSDIESGSLYFKCTPYGAAKYAAVTAGSVKCIYSGLCLTVQATA